MNPLIKFLLFSIALLPVAYLWADAEKEKTNYRFELIYFR